MDTKSNGRCSEDKMEFRTIKALCDLVVDCPHSTPAWTEQGKIVIRNNNIKNGKIDLSSPSFTDDENFAQRTKRALPKAGDIVITREAPMGEVGMIPEKVECCLGQRMVLLRVNNQLCDNYYLLYSLQSSIVQQQISWSMGTGTTVSNLRIPHLEQIRVPYVPLDKQKQISSVLRAIEEKIDNNSKLNDNLEQQATAYFQELFINNANPMWKIGTISDLGTVVGGSTPSKTKPEYYTNTGIAWITPKDLSINKSKFISHGENDITELGLKNSSATLMPKGTVLFSSRAPIGYIAIASDEVTTNQGFKSVVPYSEIGTAFVYFFLKQSLPVIEGAASGSTFKEISGSAMKNIPAIVPDRSILDQFNSFCAPIFAQQKILEDQNHSLAILRDALLPKLMSGAIDAANIQL